MSQACGAYTPDMRIVGANLQEVCQLEADARRFLDEMRTRLQEFALTLHPEKTRLIECCARRCGPGTAWRPL